MAFLSQHNENFYGMLPVNKPKGKTSFSLVSVLRKWLGVQKIGHAGTLDPFATGVMVMLIGKPWTKLSDQFLSTDKEYLAHIKLGSATDTYDCEGTTIQQSSYIPSQEAVIECLTQFQGTIQQIPPMFSAKKYKGKKLYELARKGKTIERAPVAVDVQTQLIHYHYPDLEIAIHCSKGTYIRSIAHDLGQLLTCGAYVEGLKRTRSGNIDLTACYDGMQLYSSSGVDLEQLASYIQT